jgi:SAM-dependent methyltransferase
MSDATWHPYLAEFHRERPGITESVLHRARADDGGNPYTWLAQALATDVTAPAVDVACGSGPLAATSSGWVGLDRNLAELRLAAELAPGRVVVADATAAPLRSGGAQAVICSMALMLFDDPKRAVAEMARLLRVGGRLVALLPATAPLTLRDRARYVRLLAALRLRRFPFRHQWVLSQPARLLTSTGLTLASLEQRRFAYPITDPDVAALWTRSLYLPGVRARRLQAARRITERWTGTSMGIPLRRLVAAKTR